MIIDWIVLGFIGMLLGIIDLLPAVAAGPPVPGGTDLSTGFSQVLGTMMLLDQGLPVHELIGAVAALAAITVVVDAFIVIRAIVRWLPSWLTGGG